MPTISPTNLAQTTSTVSVERAPVPQKFGQTDTTESHPAASATPESVAEAPKLSPELAKLAEKERAVRAQARAVQAEKNKIQAEQAAIKAERGEYEKLKAWKERAKTDPYGALLDQGLTADQVAALMLNQPAPVDQNITLLKQELQALKDAQEQAKTQAEEFKTQQYAEAKKQILREVTLLVDGDESFELIKADGAQQLVVDTIEEYYKEHGELLTSQEAANHIEEILLERNLKTAQLKKVKARLGELAQPQAPVTPPTSKSPQNAAPTLTNRMSQSSTPKKALSWAERRERAILAAQGQLK